MLDHTKIYVEKIYYIDAELEGHVGYIKFDVKRSMCWSGSSLSAVCMLAKPYHFGVNWPTTLCENKDGYISLPTDLNDLIGIKSCYCVILKMVILHDATKTIQNRGFCVFFLKKEHSPVFISKKQKKTD